MIILIKTIDDKDVHRYAKYKVLLVLLYLVIHLYMTILQREESEDKTALGYSHLVHGLGDMLTAVGTLVRDARGLRGGSNFTRYLPSKVNTFTPSSDPLQPENSRSPPGQLQYSTYIIQCVLYIIMAL